MAIATFTTGSEVKRVARLTNEIPDDEIEDFIESVNQEMIREHGYPIKRIRTTIDPDIGSYYLNTKQNYCYLTHLLNNENHLD